MADAATMAWARLPGYDSKFHCWRSLKRRDGSTQAPLFSSLCGRMWDGRNFQIRSIEFFDTPEHGYDVPRCAMCDGMTRAPDRGTLRGRALQALFDATTPMSARDVGASAYGSDDLSNSEKVRTYQVLRKLENVGMAERDCCGRWSAVLQERSKT